MNTIQSVNRLYVNTERNPNCVFSSVFYDNMFHCIWLRFYEAFILFSRNALTKNQVLVLGNHRHRKVGTQSVDRLQWVKVVRCRQKAEKARLGKGMRLWWWWWWWGG